MKRKLALSLVAVPILFLLLTQTGCYAPAYYPSYDTGYGGTVPYQGGYPASGYRPAEPGGDGQPDYQGYDAQEADRQGYREDDEDEEDEDWHGRGDPNRPWQNNPYGGYYPYGSY
jgi:hypothetical protein